MPRIADGSAAKSVANSYRTTTAVTVTAGNVGHVLLWPGLQLGLAWCNGTPGGINGVSHIRYNNTGDLTCAINGFTSSGGAQTGLEWSPTTSIAKWRLVSQGLRLTCIDNDQTNDGFYEAVRVNRKKSVRDWYPIFPTANNPPDAIMVPNYNNLINDLVNDTLVDDDSYMCGSIKSLATRQFNLKPTKNEVRFKPMKNVMLFDTESELIAAPNTAIGGDSGSDDVYEILETYQDWDYDMIYIRLHPGSVNNGNFLMESCVNFEYIFDQTSTLSKYMDPTAYIAMQDNVTAARNATPMAAESRPASDGIMVSEGQATFDKIKEVGGWAADTLMYAWQNPDSVSGRILAAALKGTAEYFLPGSTLPPVPVPLPISSSDRQLVPYEYNRVRTTGSKYQKAVVGEEMEGVIFHA
jgi:hypothetical protein